jgi:hypothetical protein
VLSNLVRRRFQEARSIDRTGALLGLVED